MRTLHCAGCRRPLGLYETAQMRSAVWCDSLCRSQPPVTVNEVRHDVMVELSRSGKPDAAIGALFGVTRSRAQKIVASRDPRAASSG